MVNNKKLNRIFLFIWIGIVTFLSVTPNTPNSSVKVRSLEFRIDYLEHFIVYFILGFLLFIAFPESFKKGMVLFGTAILLLVLFSAVTEFIQYFIPGRTYNPVDLILNSAGSIFGVLLAVVHIKRQNKKALSNGLKVI